MRILSAICLLCLFVCCDSNEEANLDFLVGTWKMEGKEQYELWEKNAKNELVGNAYTIVDNEKKITESLRIKSVGDKLMYQATVSNQNDGKTIEFSLNRDNNELLSFENDSHDFPKKIQYKIISEDSIKVNVLGANDKGFSFIQVKQRMAE